MSSIVKTNSGFVLNIVQYYYLMPNTYSQIHIQFVFSVKYRHALIDKSWKEQLHKYITGIVQNHNHKMLCINSMPDHIHIFLGMRPHQSVSELAQKIKAESSKWIKEMNFCKEPFYWQEGYGAFSYSKSHTGAVIAYINNQEEHHKKETFLAEYRRLLSLFDIEWNEAYIFKELV